MRREPELVKKSADAAEKRALGGGFRRHLQGYELGLLTVGMVLTFAFLVLPRASRPLTLPLPRVDRVEARRRAESEQELAARAEATGLPFEVRAVGESIRHFGQSLSRGLDTGHDVDDIRERVQTVFAKGQESRLLQLRAVQTRYFLRALAQFEREGKPNHELEELAGDFLRHAQHNGWFGPSGRFLADEPTRRVLYQLHWADLIGKRGTFPYAQSLNDWRLYYRFLLLHPERSQPLSTDGADEANSARLRVVSALSRKDPDYPAFFARGYLLAALGDAQAAATAFRTHLGQHEGGPYALLARNYLIHTLHAVDSE